MYEVLTGPFEMTGFVPRKACGTGWSPALIWLHSASDIFIWLAYLSIPLVLLYFTKRRDLPFPRLFVLFALFILACGTTHLVDALIFEYPIYRFAGIMKFVTAVVSWATVIALVPVIPRVMQVVSDAGKPSAETKAHAPLAAARRNGRARDYIVAVLAGVLSILIRGVLDPVLKEDHVFVLALFAVVYVSWRCGFGPGVVCLCVSVGGYSYLFIPPRNSIYIEGFGNQLVVALFFFCGMACAALGESQRLANRRAARALSNTVARRDELESEVMRRRVVEAALRQREAELVAAQAETAEVLARLDAFLDNAPLGIAFFDPDLRYRRINTYLAAANGRSVDAHTGRPLPELVPDFPADVLARYRQTAGPDGQPFTVEMKRPDARKGGALCDWQLTVFPIRDSSARNLGAGVVAQDVTDRLHAEAELRSSEQRFRTLADAMPPMVWTARPDGHIDYYNERWYAFTGFERGQTGDASWEPILHPDDVERCRTVWYEAVRTGKPYEIEYRFKDRTTGGYRWFMGRALPDRDGTGTIVKWYGSCTDIDTQRTAAARVADANLFLEATIDALAKHVAVLDERGTILKTNAAWRKFAETNELRAANYGIGSNYLAVSDVACPSGEGATVSDSIRAVIDGTRDSYRSVYPCHSPTEQRWFQMRVNRFPGTGPVRVVVTHEDITARVVAEEQLRESEERLRRTVDGTATPTILHADDGTILTVNRALTEITGYTHADIPTIEDWTERAYGARHATAQEYIDGLFASNARVDNGEWEVTTATGEKRIWHFYATPMGREPSGRRLMVSNAVDVTEIKRSAEQLRTSEEFRRRVFENSPDCVKILDADGRLIEMNQAGCRLLEMDDFAQVRDANWSELWPVTNRTTIQEAVTSARSGGVGRFQGFCPTAKGTPKYWDVSVASVPDAHGQPYRLIVVSRDVTEQRRAEDVIRTSERRFRTLTEAVPQMVWTSDPRGVVTYYNRRWVEYTGQPFDATTPREWGGDAIHPDDADRVRTVWAQALGRSGEEFSHEFRLRHAADGEYRWMLAVAVPLTDATGTVTDWVGAVTDIDDQKRQTELLARLVRERTVELQRSNDDLEQFAYIASHDLQEPLRKVQAFGDRLKTKFRDQLPETGQEYVDRMLKAAGRMRRLIDDLLAFSRVTSQQRPFARVELGALVREVVSDLEVRIGETRGSVLIGALPEIDADPTQMRQLFQNLIGNAIKFHRAGVPPVVEVSGAPADPGPPAPDGSAPVPSYRFTVRDNGIGFDVKYRDRIFDVFQRLHGRDEYEGTGVGLAICRKIAARHGGTITAESRVGEGTTFVVVLPARHANTHEETALDEHPPSNHDPGR